MSRKVMGNMTVRTRLGAREGGVLATAEEDMSVVGEEEALVVGIRMVQGGGVGV